MQQWLSFIWAQTNTPCEMDGVHILLNSNQVMFMIWLPSTIKRPIWWYMVGNCLFLSYPWFFSTLQRNAQICPLWLYFCKYFMQALHIWTVYCWTKTKNFGNPNDLGVTLRWPWDTKMAWKSRVLMSRYSCKGIISWL